ncbi:MAG: DUF2877 domain-containing protein [Promethearchaeota archaeon]
MRCHIHCLKRGLNQFEDNTAFKSQLKSKISFQNKQNILSEIEDHLREFRMNLTHLKDKPVSYIMGNLSHILGYGLGSTPQSDDIFLGILAAIYCLNNHVQSEFEFLSKLPFERFTTSESAQLCRNFLHQNFPSEIIPFLELLKDPLNDNYAKFRFEEEIHKINSIGTSSGYYFLLGVLWELEYDFNCYSKKQE